MNVKETLEEAERRVNKAREDSWKTTQKYGLDTEEGRSHRDISNGLYVAQTIIKDMMSNGK